MSRQLSIIGVLVAVLLPIGQIALAQTPDDHNEGSQLSFDSENAIYRFSWWGRQGKSYFIQHSEDLMSWEYLPLLETVANAGAKLPERELINFTRQQASPSIVSEADVLYRKMNRRANQ